MEVKGKESINTKRVLTVVFSLIATTQRLQEGVDGISINTNNLACTWRVKVKGKRSIKEEEGNERGGSRV